MSMNSNINQQTINAYRQFADALMHKVYDKNTKGRVFVYHQIKRIRKALDNNLISKQQKLDLKIIEKMMRNLL